MCIRDRCNISDSVILYFIKSMISRNTLCGTWYLPHSRVHAQWLNRSYNYGFPVRHENFGDCSINRNYNAYFSFYVHETAYFYIRSEIWRHHSVSRPGCPIRRQNFGHSQIFEEYTGLVMFAWIFRTSWPKMGLLVVSGKIWELVLTFGSYYLSANFGGNRSRMRPWECAHTDR